MDDKNDIQIAEYVRPDGESYHDWDTLGLDSAREAFLKIIQKVTPPLTIGLYGQWGSGKTEMIKALAEDLEKDSCLTLIFDAWKYRHEKNLVLPLMCSLEDKISVKNLDVKPIKKWWRNRKKELPLIGSLLLVLANQYIKKELGLDFYKAEDKVKKQVLKHYQQYIDNVKQVEKEYCSFINSCLNPVEQRLDRENTSLKSKKVILFIDNLDRCLPDVVLNLLEDISTFLKVANVPCIYILAMDKENVIKAINHRHPDFDGVHYLEKIVHVALKMPLPRKRENHNSNYGRYHFLKRYEWGKKYEDVLKSGDSRSKLFEKLVAIDNVFGGDLLGNPRRGERIVNKLMMLEAMELFQAEKNPDDLPVLIFLLLLCEYFPKVYESLKDDTDFKYLHTSLQMCEQKETTPFKKRKERESLGPNSYIPNEIILNAYCDDEKFFQFIKGFVDLANINELPKRLMQIKDNLNYIG